MPDSPEHDGCEHPFDLHVMVSPENPLQGGFGVCPVVGCKCFFTWGVGRNSERPALALSPKEIDEIRIRVQTGEM